MLAQRCIEGAKIMGPIDSLHGQWRRAVPGINMTASVIGSICYLVGSVLFLPDLEDYLNIGEGVFITGSAIIFFSQIWKVIRIGYTNISDRQDRRFRITNLMHNFVVFVADAATDLGGLFYFIGTILFLPKFITTNFGLNRAAGLFITGGTFFYYWWCFFLSFIIFVFLKRSNDSDEFDPSKE